MIIVINTRWVIISLAFFVFALGTGTLVGAPKEVVERPEEISEEAWEALSGFEQQLIFVAESHEAIESEEEVKGLGNLVVYLWQRADPFRFHLNLKRLYRSHSYDGVKEGLKDIIAIQTITHPLEMSLAPILLGSGVAHGDPILMLSSLPAFIMWLPGGIFDPVCLIFIGLYSGFHESFIHHLNNSKTRSTYKRMVRVTWPYRKLVRVIRVVEFRLASSLAQALFLPDLYRALTFPKDHLQEFRKIRKNEIDAGSIEILGDLSDESLEPVKLLFKNERGEMDLELSFEKRQVLDHERGLFKKEVWLQSVSVKSVDMFRSLDFKWLLRGLSSDLVDALQQIQKIDRKNSAGRGKNPSDLVFPFYLDHFQLGAENSVNLRFVSGSIRQAKFRSFRSPLKALVEICRRTGSSS